MYTEEQLQDAVICTAKCIAKLYSNREELEKAVNELADDKVRTIVMATVIATIGCRKIIDLVKSI